MLHVYPLDVARQRPQSKRSKKTGIIAPQNMKNPACKTGMIESESI